MIAKKTKVLVVDDSALIRALLTEVLESDPRLEVCGAATDPYEARELIKQLHPDVITLDIEMPKMNGIAFLKNLMRLRPMPVVMISTLTQDGAPATLQALELGAVDFVPKPKNEGADSLAKYRDDICAKVYTAARANVRQTFSEHVQPTIKVARIAEGLGRAGYICALGASTGGTEAIKDVVTKMPENCPAIVATQHIPAAFSASFAKRLDRISAPTVYEAEHDQAIAPGNVYIAPGHSHLRVAKLGNQYVCKLDQGERVNRHRPAVDVLFDSVVEHAGNNCIGALLTGMGADGAAGLLKMREAGAHTIAQDEASSVVWGMPGAAVQMNAACEILAIDKVAEAINRDYLRK